jgi:hypothetical protein
MMYHGGEGLPQDAAKAKYWLAKADQHKLADEQADREKQQRLAQQVQEAQGFQAQQADQQRRVQAARRAQQNAQANAQAALLGLLLGGIGSGSNADSDSAPHHQECRESHGYGTTYRQCRDVSD